MRFVTSVHMIDSDLHLNGFVRVNQKKVPNEWLDSESSPRMEYVACNDDHAEKEILEDTFQDEL